MPRAARKWTPEEDNLLSREVHSQLAEGKVKDWTVIANKIPGRTNKDCRKRWHNVLSGGFNKGYWTEEEDKLLTRAVQTHGETWTAVAEVVKTRSADQCAKRWKQCLDPQLDRSEWTEDDNRRLVEIAAVKGRRWKEIQTEYFPSRSRNTIKNQYTILTRRENKLRPSKSRKLSQRQEDLMTKETALPTEWSSDDEDDEDDESSCEEDEDGSAEEESSRRGPRNCRGDQSVYSSTSNSDPTLAVPTEVSVYAGPDALPWDDLSAGASGHAWDPTMSSDTDFPGHGFNGTLPDLPTVSPDVLQGFGRHGSDAAKQAFYPDLLSPVPTDISGLFGQGVPEMAEVESQQPAIIPLQGIAVPRQYSRGNKVVLTVEEPDHRTVEALVQVAFLSGTPFHLARG
ncbi:hypothetical protein Asppvi_005390 [Aspergillus pseudoviridinutans]|uniref:Homeodomain-like protein n=1 Tax=Aspergillus pseudoviridinutans TaxID=1517512 RepID=A0A9P3ESJ7_9EURO|nr:uncharacterized protein Asppvi_005390 [Aspergillus pseudoviridinutans]GIJ86501.1 hypothetical protein Asppvi_005390 [Aspergillus pseudoviridinutans]